MRPTTPWTGSWLFLLKAGMTGLNIDYDVPTKVALDPDHPLAEGDVGMVGTSVATQDDVEELYAGIPLEKVSSTLICQPPASAFIVASYVLMAEKRGIPKEKLIGTIMNCGFTQLVGPTYQSNTTFYPIEFTYRIGLDVMEYCAKAMPKWNLVNVNAYNIRETGVNAIEEAAFAMMVASQHIEGLLARGIPVDVALYGPGRQRLAQELEAISGAKPERGYSRNREKNI